MMALGAGLMVLGTYLIGRWVGLGVGIERTQVTLSKLHGRALAKMPREEAYRYLESMEKAIEEMKLEDRA